MMKLEKVKVLRLFLDGSRIDPPSEHIDTLSFMTCCMPLERENSKECEVMSDHLPRGEVNGRNICSVGEGSLLHAYTSTSGRICKHLGISRSE